MLKRPGRRRTQRPELPLYHIPGKKSSKNLHKIEQKFFPKIVHFALHHAKSLARCYAKFCPPTTYSNPHMRFALGQVRLLSDVASIWPYGPGKLRPFNAGRGPEHLTFIKKYDIIVKKPFFISADGVPEIFQILQYLASKVSYVGIFVPNSKPGLAVASSYQ